MLSLCNSPLDTRVNTCYTCFTDKERRNSVKGSELLKLLKENGVLCIEHRANHDWFYSPITGEYFPVPRHKGQDIKPKTLQSILKAAGIKTDKR